MQEVTAGILARLTKEGAKDINLLVHSYYVGRPSPCVVIRDWVNQGMIGGCIESVEQIFDLEVAKHPDYTVRERAVIVVDMSKLQEEKLDSTLLEIK
jgi:hypothetical protein